MLKGNLEKMTASAMKLTEEITTRWSSRLVGSAACLEAGQFLYEQMETFCDTTFRQEFSVRPGAFLGYIKINVVLYFVAMGALFLGFHVVAVSLAMLAILITVLEFFFYFEFVDFLYPKKTGMNVFGKIEPKGEVRQQIIVSAHHDSAHVFNFLQDNAKDYVKKIIGGTGSMFLFAIITWLHLVFEIRGGFVWWASLALCSFMAILVGRLWFFYRQDEGTPGAGDNMICTAMALEICKHFSKAKSDDKGLEHTRLIVASWDSEEAGLRGARAYLKEHAKAHQKLKTYNFNLESMYDHKELKFLTSDLNNFQPLSKDMVNDCLEVSQALNYDIKAAPFPFLAGGTDAAEFGSKGIEATTLVGMSFESLGDNPAYHTLRDTIDAVDPVAVFQGIHVGLEYIKRKDQEL